jgi:hypothetical protein
MPSTLVSCLRIDIVRIVVPNLVFLGFCLGFLVPKKKYWGESDSEEASNSWLTSDGDSSQLIVSNLLGSSSSMIRVLSLFEGPSSSSED